MGKKDWVGAFGHQYETEEEYKEALGYYACRYCGAEDRAGDLPRPLPNPQFCSSCIASEHVRSRYGLENA